MPNCNPEKSKPCGNACIRLTHTCRKDNPRVPGVRRVRVGPPVCREGVSRPCGNACISIHRNCRKDGTTGVPKQTVNNDSRFRVDKQLLAEATRMQLEINKMPPGAARSRRQLECDRLKLRAGIPVRGINLRAGFAPIRPDDIPSNPFAANTYTGVDAGRKCPFCKEVMPAGYWNHIQQGCSILNPNPQSNRWNTGVI